MDVRVTPIDPLLTIHKSAVISIFLHFVHGRYRTARTWDYEWVGMVKWTVFYFDRTGPTENRGPPRKVDHLFQNFSGCFRPKFQEILVKWIAPMSSVFPVVHDKHVIANVGCIDGMMKMSSVIDSHKP